MKEITLKVCGMSCEGCEKRIENILNKIEEIEKVLADHNKGEVKIILKNDFDISVIKDEIESLGFEVV